ncbi:hypothetical protein [Paenibacillus rigui]|uniref:Uncharacterized protein n=1 Tax=Paenibacillus rigui TaxID=554312 RepID=A0A229UXS4_9BACL|nr:hypothetical protein [Paenibacillus rigui]OXM88238.1 hypothetical protein CF651_01280 [Paenibacillus rigui]
MNYQFIKIKSLEGELKISHKKSDFGITVSTKELVYQKPHANYHIQLEHIISIMPFEPLGGKGITFQNKRASGNEIINMSSGMSHYRIHVQNATLHNRSGIFTLGAAQFILPVHDDLLLAISKYGGLSAVI